MRKLPLLASLAVLATAILGMAPAGASAYTLLEDENGPLKLGTPIDIVATYASWSDPFSPHELWCPKIETTVEVARNKSKEAEAPKTVPETFPPFKCDLWIYGFYHHELEFTDYTLSPMEFFDDGTVQFSIESGLMKRDGEDTCNVLPTSTVSASWENGESGASLLFDKHLKFSGMYCDDLLLSGSFSLTLTYDGTPVTISTYP